MVSFNIFASIAFLLGASTLVVSSPTPAQKYHCAPADKMNSPLCYEHDKDDSKLFFCDYAFGFDKMGCPGSSGNPTDKHFICAYNKLTGVVDPGHSNDQQGRGSSGDQFCPPAVTAFAQ